MDFGEFNDSEFNPIAFPFTEAEMSLLFRVTTSANEARDLVAELFAEQRRTDHEYEDYQRNQEEIDRRTDETGEGPAFGWLLSADLLIILSLVNGELEEKVERYRRWLHRGDPTDQQYWDAQREQMRPWVAERLAIIRSEES